MQRPWSTPAATGLNFELLNRVQKQLGEHFIYAAKPWRRCLQELHVGTVDAVIAAADSADRRRFAILPMLPDGQPDPSRALFETTVDVYLRVGGQGAWDGHHLTSPNSEVAIPAGYQIATQLRADGLQPRELVKSAEDGLRLLASGMFDVAVLQGGEASQLARHDPRFRDRVVQMAPPYAVMPLHLMVSRKTYARDPQRIETIWRGIATVRQSGDYRQLLGEAGVEPR